MARERCVGSKLFLRVEESAATELLRRGSRRFSRGYLCTTMAGVAGNVTLSVRKLHVDLARHLEHHACGFFLRIVVASKIALHMAECASLTERGGECTHGHLELWPTFASQNLQIFRRSKWVAPLFLGAEADGDKQQDSN